MARIGSRLSKDWNNYWRLIPSLSIGKRDGIILQDLRRNACLAIGYGATPRPWASAAGKVVGSGRGATSPRSHSEPNIDVASDGSRRAVRFDEPGHRLVRRRREGARGVGYVGRPGELT